MKDYINIYYKGEFVSEDPPVELDSETATMVKAILRGELSYNYNSSEDTYTYFQDGEIIAVRYKDYIKYYTKKDQVGYPMTEKQIVELYGHLDLSEREDVVCFNFRGSDNYMLDEKNKIVTLPNSVFVLIHNYLLAHKYAKVKTIGAHTSYFSKYGEFRWAHITDINGITLMVQVDHGFTLVGDLPYLDFFECELESTSFMDSLKTIHWNPEARKEYLRLIRLLSFIDSCKNNHLALLKAQISSWVLDGGFSFHSLLKLLERLMWYYDRENLVKDKISAVRSERRRRIHVEPLDLRVVEKLIFGEEVKNELIY